MVEYSKSYRKTTGSLWNYYRDEPNNPLAYNYNADTITNSVSFRYKNNFTWKTRDNDHDDNNTKDVEIAVPLKYLNHFWRTLDIPLIEWYNNTSCCFCLGRQSSKTSNKCSNRCKDKWCQIVCTSCHSLNSRQ